MNAWDNLPNASHINWVLESMKANLDEWDAATGAARAATGAATGAAVWDATGAATGAARAAAKVAVWAAARDAAGDAAGDDAGRPGLGAARAAMLSLIAYDHAAKYLDMKYDDLLIWALLSNDPAAILMLTAVKAQELILQKQSSLYETQVELYKKCA